MADTPPPLEPEPEPEAETTTPPPPPNTEQQVQNEQVPEEAQTPPPPIYDPDVQNLINAAKALCENNTLPLETKRNNAAIIITKTFISSSKLLLRTGKYILDGASYYLEKIPMVGGAIVIGLHSFVYLSLLSLVLLIINPMIPGHEITIRGVAWTIINTISYLIQTMFIILWKNLAPDNGIGKLKNIQNEMITRMMFILDEFFSKLTMIKAMNDRIDSLYELVEIILKHMKGLYDGTTGAVYTGAATVYNVGEGSIITATKMAGNGYEISKDVLNAGTTAASEFAKSLLKFANGQPQTGGGNNSLVINSNLSSMITTTLNDLKIDGEDNVVINDLIELSKNMDNLYVNGNVDDVKGKIKSSLDSIGKKLDKLEKNIDEAAITKKVEEYVKELSSAEIDKLIKETIIIPNMIFSFVNIVVAFREISEKYINELRVQKLEEQLKEFKDLQKGGKSKKNINIRIKRKKSITLKRRRK
jgi:hypothetical protein